MNKFDYKIIENPNIVRENCLPAHSDHVCMPNWFEGEYNSLRMSLDGLWKFSCAKNMNLSIEGFEMESYSCKDWDEIRVPNEKPAESSSVASYVKYFTLPVNMRGERVCISFQGVESGFAVWLNGHYVGYSENSFEPAEFELTAYLKDGENKLAVRVWKWTSSSGYEDQDIYGFSGIFRSVYLYMVPRTHLWDVQIVPELSEDLSEATLTIITTSCGKGEVEIRLLDNAMVPVLEGVMALEEGDEASDEIQSGIAGMVYQPKLWSAENPNLYMLQLEVRDEYGDLTEVISQYVGFSRFEIKDGKMLLNGKPIVLNGVKSHGFSEDITNDIMRMKQNNVNAVRTSQFRNNPFLYELCDEYGLYLMADHGNLSCDIKSHHPSVLIWSRENMNHEDIHELEPRMQEVKYIYQNISVEFAEKTFTVWNKNLFVNTDAYVASVILQKDGINIAKVELPVSVEPMEQKCFDIPQQLLDIMDNLKIASAVHDGEIPEFAITVSFALPADNAWGKRGHEVAFGQYVYKKEVEPYTCKESLEVVRGKNHVVIKGLHFKALFSNLNEGLVSYVYGGVEMFKSIPRPNFWSVPGDKDRGRWMQRYAQWKIASMYVTGVCQDESKDTSPAIEELENSVKLTYTFYMPTAPASCCQVCYHVFGDGTVETTMEYESVEGLEDMPEFGMMFKLDSEFNRLTWYGLGPDETYAEHMQGGKLGIYENKVADNMSKSLCTQDGGNKCSVRYAELTNESGRGMRFFGDEITFRALPYTPHELENAEHLYELPAVNYTVVRVAQQQNCKKKVFTFCFRGV